MRKTNNSRKTWLFRALVALVPVALLVLAELALSLAGFGRDLRLFIPYEPAPGYRVQNPNVALRYFPRHQVGGFGSEDVFSRKKEPNTLRIFAFGGSATGGFPYFFNGSFPALLKDRLVQAYPDYEIEMINLGMTAVTSYAVLDFADEVLDHDPDLLILYTGHNEFYGALGSASTQSGPLNRPLTLGFLKLKHLKLFQLIESLLASLSPSQEETGTLMARMAREKAIPYESTLYNKTLKTFEANLESIIKKAQRKKVPVLIGTLVSNLADQPPFVSIHRKGSDSLRVNLLLDQANQKLQAAHYPEALTLTEKALQLDSTFALAHFIQAGSFQALNQAPEAREAFIKARDTDGLRFRASSHMNAILKSLSQTDGVFLVDLEDTFQEASPHGLIGKDLMLEHLHPNLEGYFLMAKAFSRTILEKNLLNLDTPPQPAKPDRWFKNRMPVTQLDKTIARYQIQVLTSGWPFVQSERRIALDDVEPSSPVEAVALDVLKGKLDYREGHLAVAEVYRQRGEFDLAVQECSVLVRAFPLRWSSHKALGQALMASNRYDEALAPFRRAVELGGDAFCHKWTGTLLIDQARPGEAIPYLEKALSLDAEDGQTRYNLGSAFWQTGNKDRAVEELEILLKTHPDYPNARELYERIR